MDGKIDIDSLITHKLPLAAHQRGVRPDARRASRSAPSSSSHDRRAGDAVGAALLRRRAGVLQPRVGGDRPVRCASAVFVPERAGAIALPRRSISWPGSSATSRRSPSRPARSGPPRRWGWCWSPATPARAPRVIPATTRAGTSARAPASTSTPRRSPGGESYRMDTYVTRELPAVVEQHFPVAAGRARHLRALDGRPRRAGAGAAQPGPVPQRLGAGAGGGAVAGAVGAARRSPATWATTRDAWSAYDACDLVRARPLPGETARSTSAPPTSSWTTQLKPELFEAACADAGQRLELRRHAGYDHGYYFVATFVDDHLAHHAAR